MNRDVVLITGAARGIGLALAHEFAKHRHPLVLTARSEIELHGVAAEIRDKYRVDTYVLAKDLEDVNAPQELFREITQQGVEVDILVNNAGLGQKGKFWDIPIERDIAMIRVNIEALVRLTKLFVAPMLQRKRGRILNTASVAGFEPGPLLAVYHASKAFVLSFSEALATELENSGVSVTALCPGPTDTDFFPKANMLKTRAFQKSSVMSPQEVARLGFEALMRGDRVYVPGGMNKALVFARRVLPVAAQAKFNEKLYQNVKPKDRKRERGDIESKAA
jgi:uncharacterized protein